MIFYITDSQNWTNITVVAELNQCNKTMILPVSINDTALGKHVYTCKESHTIFTSINVVVQILVIKSLISRIKIIALIYLLRIYR